MTTLLISRHPGAIDWVKAQNIPIDKILNHLKDEELEALNSGDTVIGNLPLHNIAKLCSKNITYWHLELKVPPELRGHELTQQDMDTCEAKLVAYWVQRKEQR